VTQAAAHPAPASPSAEKVKAGSSLRRKAVSGGVWTVGGFGAVQFLRFGSNILLAQVLAPHDFGLMMLVTVVLIGLQMFSDIGIGPALIQNARTDEAFVNTAWTMQAIRGVVLWAVAAALAFPLTWLWPDAALLAWVLPVAALSAAINGLLSTNWFTANRHLAVKKMLAIDLSAMTIQIVVLVALVYTIMPNVWALVVGSLLNAVIRVAALASPSGRAQPLHVRSRRRAGALPLRQVAVPQHGGHVLRDADRQPAAPVVPGAGHAGPLQHRAEPLEPRARPVEAAGRDRRLPRALGGVPPSPERFDRQLAKVRFMLVAPIHVLLLGMVVLGPSLFYLLYPLEYWGTGWIVQALCINSLAGMLNTSYGQAYMATGRTRYNLVTVSGQLVCVIAGALLGWHLGGETGFILGVTFSQWFKYPVDAWLAKKMGMWQWKFDAVMLVGSGALALLALVAAEWVAPYSMAAGPEVRAAAGAMKDSAKALLGFGG
jgi:O-antigen/teichoic acid export membrane protein